MHVNQTRSIVVYTFRLGSPPLPASALTIIMCVLGGVKMASSSVAVALILWIIVQFGSQSALSVFTDTASALLKQPVDTVQSYLNTYTG